MKKIFIVAVLGTFSSVAAFADGCTGGGSSGDTLTVASNLSITNGSQVSGTATGSCTIGGYTFSNFEIYGSTGWAAGSDIDLTVSIDNGGVEGAIAINYSNPTEGTVGDFLLTYTVTPGLTAIGLNTGTALSVTENVCSALGGTYGAFSGCGAGDSLTPGGTPISFTGTYSLSASGTGHDIITKDISGGSEVYQQVIPEPMTMSLMGLGLLGLGFFGRRIRK